jgi:hypothetical protein
MGMAVRDWSARERRILVAEKQEKWLIARRSAKRE